LKIGAPTISHHIKQLGNAGLISRKKKEDTMLSLQLK
jgi:DNA-binding transcriptional ArsR family regulator